MTRKVLAALGLATGLAAAPAALAAPPTDAPAVEQPPAFVSSANGNIDPDPLPAYRRLAWTPVGLPGCGSYEVEITDRTTGAVSVVEAFPAVGHGMFQVGAGTAPPTTMRFGEPPYSPRDATNHAALTDGHVYAFRVRAVDREPAPAAYPYPSPYCRFGPVGTSEPGPWSPMTTDTRHDSRVPEATVVINGDRPYARRHVATVDVARLVDPDPPGVPRAASGIAQLTVNGDPVAAGTTRVPLFLPGADGVKTIEFVARDNAGNTSVGRDVITLDTTPPAVALRRTSVTAPAGAVVSYAAAVTDPKPPPLTTPIRSGDEPLHDASGVPGDGMRWRFGDGLPGSLTTTPTHVFRRAGVYCGLATARDRAGNVGRAEFVSRIGPTGRRPVMGRARIVGRAKGGRAVRVEVCLGARTTLRATVSDRAGVHRARVVRGPGLVELRLRARPGRVTVALSVGRERRVLA